MLKKILSPLIAALVLAAGVLVVPETAEAAPSCKLHAAVSARGGRPTGRMVIACQKAKQDPVKRTPSTTAADPPRDSVSVAEADARWVADCQARVSGQQNKDLCAEHLIKLADKPSTGQVELVARQVVARLRLPDPTPRIGPDPSVNQWNMTAVGFPLWLWTDPVARLSTTARAQGLSFTLTATRTTTVFTMGDGHQLSCTAMSVYTDAVTPGHRSPTCGYTYQQTSPKGHPFTVSAATRWQVSWSSMGYHGMLTTSYTGQRELVVGELHSIIVG